MSAIAPEHRQFLQEHAISDEVIDRYVVSDRDGWGLRWDDGSDSPFWLPVFDPDKRPLDREGKPMKARFPSRAQGGGVLGPNVLRMPDNPVGVLAVEGLKQSLAALSHAPDGWAVVGLNGVRGVHPGNVARCTWAKGLRVVVLPDADYRTKPAVKAGADETARLLLSAGAASVAIAAVPGLGTDGVDDVLARTVPAARADLLTQVVESAQPVGGEVAATSRLEDAFYELGELDNLPAPEPLLDGLLDRGTVAVLAGKFGTYKSFVALAWSASVATGRPWGTFTVPEARRVLYVAAEGASGLRKRLTAWQERHGAIPPGSVYVVTRPVRMTSDEDAAWLREKVREVGAGLVVIDTWRQSTPGAEENSNTEMSAAFSRAASIRSDTGATILIVHHTGHAGERSRGASSIEDDADSTFVIKLAGQDSEDRSAANPRVMEHRKAKDGELLSPTGLVAHEVGESLVVEPSPFAVSIQRGRGRPKDVSKEQAIDTMVKAADAAGVPVKGYRELYRWACDNGVARVTEAIAKEAARLRQGRKDREPEEDEGAAAGAVAAVPPRGAGTAPHSPDQCGENTAGIFTASRPAETPSAADCGGKSEGFFTAPPEGTAAENAEAFFAALSEPCPDCGEPTVVIGSATLCSTYDTARCDPAFPLCPDCGEPTVRSEDGSGVDLLCIQYEDGGCDWVRPLDHVRPGYLGMAV